MHTVFPISSRFFLIIFLFAGRQSFGQATKATDYKIGDIVTDTLQFYDTTNAMHAIKIPAHEYLFIYRYNWVNVGKGVDTQDSIKEFEKRLALILSEKQFKHSRVICLSYDRGKGYENWIQKIKKEKPFAANPKYKVEYLNTNGNDKLEERCRNMLSKVAIIAPNGRIVKWASTISRFDYNPKSHSTTTLKAKLFCEDKHGKKEALADAVVHLASPDNLDTIAYAVTNKNGDFTISYRGYESDYIIKVDAKNPDVHNIILATQSGTEISKIHKSAKGFEYKLLEPDMVRLIEMEAEDVDVKFGDFAASNEKELFTAENIFYNIGESAVSESSFSVLNKIVKILKDNPKVRVEIISHTDSQGEEEANMQLSKKRAAAVAEYFIKNGIPANRLRTTGKGETDIRNKCAEGVKCTDKEHEYNRRTEFVYIKTK